MQSFAAVRVAFVWVSVLLANTLAQMPYNPTRLLQNGTLLYVFQPSTASPSQFELCSIDISSSVPASNPPYTALYPTLPFLDAKTQRAFTPVLDQDGNITVYTGDCANGAGGGEVWTFALDASSKSGSGSWKQESISFDQGGKHIDAIGSNFLNAGMSFSAVVDGDATDTGVYFFGGMCPSQNSDADWQSSANYSNLMVTLEPSQNGKAPLNYHLDVSSSRGPPIAEAGFTLTGLQPSFSNRSDGTQTQQQNFVLVGGHTSEAFINMSQVALFSLPQQAWTFVPVLQPNPQRTDLAVRTDVDEVAPRSGHSAVVTPDGQKIVLFGGWVGDINTPADPQLAVLNIGEGYGGQGSWEWTVPSVSGASVPSYSGLYGHGAAMLPGGVMMIKGGFSTAQASSRWRRAAQTANSETFFFNVSSSTWISAYTPPKAVSSAPDKSGPLANPGQKAGLGAGLGVGMAAVFGLMVFYVWYTRRLKKQREIREKQLQDLALGAHRYNLESLNSGVAGRGGHGEAVDYFDDPHDSYLYPATGKSSTQGWRSTNGHDAERTGLLVEIPSPTRGLRRSLSGRPTPQTLRYDDRRVRGSGHIHPIDELDEEQEADLADDKTPFTTTHPEMAEQSSRAGASIFDNAPILDPFTDKGRASGGRKDQKNPIHSAPTSPIHETGESGHGAMDWALGIGALLPRRSSPTSDDRVSPDKSERTGSNLSDRSIRSHISSTSHSGSLGRSASMRPTAILNNASQTNPFKTPDVSPTTAKAYRNSGGWESPVDPRTHSFTSLHSNGRPNTANDDKESFATARTSFMHLQAEGEALLGGNPERPRPGTSSTINGSPPRTYQDTEPSMSRAGATTAATSVVDAPPLFRERRKSWLGSVRRALSRSTTTAADARTHSLTLDQYTDNPVSPTLSPDPNHTAHNCHSLGASTSPPRRAASDASFWRSKRGKQDWLDDEEVALPESDPRSRWRRNSGDDWGAPEDVMLAEKERRRREWRERNHLLNLADEPLPTPRTPIEAADLGVGRERSDRPSTPAEEEDWDVEAAVERRVVQVMFTVPKSKLRVVNADVDRSSIMSLPRDKDKEDGAADAGSAGSPSRVKDLAGRFEQMGSNNSPRGSASTPRASPKPSPSPSIRSLKVRGKVSQASLQGKRSSPSLAKVQARLASEDITNA